MIRFAVVGIGVMLTFMALNAAMEPYLGKQGAFLAAYPPAIALHFCLNKWWTFGCRRTDAARQVSEYVLMVLVTFAIQWAVFTGVLLVFPVPSWVAAGIANVTQMAITFLVMQRRVFAKRTAP